jgi:hypothetical protein
VVVVVAVMVSPPTTLTAMAQIALLVVTAAAMVTRMGKGKSALCPSSGEHLQKSPHTASCSYPCDRSIHSEMNQTKRCIANKRTCETSILVAENKTPARISSYQLVPACHFRSLPFFGSYTLTNMDSGNQTNFKQAKQYAQDWPLV